MVRGWTVEAWPVRLLALQKLVPKLYSKLVLRKLFVLAVERLSSQFSLSKTPCTAAAY